MCTRVVYVACAHSACDMHTAYACAHGVLCRRVACACVWQCTHACGMCTYTRVWVWVHTCTDPGVGAWAAQVHRRSPRGVWASASAGTQSLSRGTRGCRRRRTLVPDMCPLSRGFAPRCSWKCQTVSLCGRDFIVPKRHGGQAPVPTAPGFRSQVDIRGRVVGVSRAQTPWTPCQPQEAEGPQSEAAAQGSVMLSSLGLTDSWPGPRNGLSPLTLLTDRQAARL